MFEISKNINKPSRYSVKGEKVEVGREQNFFHRIRYDTNEA
jgi:hypothetical protein